MKIYAVGGAVRDELLGLPVKDRDYVVVGATPEEMIAQGYRPVGKDFPVFLHPRTHEEYALARTERKSGRGYRGFQIFASPEVTLEDDLARRDLTINAMARDEGGALVDPFNGAADIQSRTLRHVGPAFVEDPVRILRVGRFAARFGFDIAPETMDLMRHMVAEGEADHLVAERVWQEFANGLMADHPARMFEALRSCGALARILPELDALFGVPQPEQHHPEIDTGDHVMRALECAAAAGEPLEVRFALLVHDLGKGTTPSDEWPRHIGHESRALPLIEALCERVRVPVACKELALAVSKWHTHVHRALELRPDTILKVLEQCDAFRRAERFDAMLRACECDARGRLGLETRAYPQIERMRAAARAASAVDAGAVARSAPDPSQIKARVHDARLEAIRTVLR